MVSSVRKIVIGSVAASSAMSGAPTAPKCRSYIPSSSTSTPTHECPYQWFCVIPRSVLSSYLICYCKASKLLGHSSFTVCLLEHKHRRNVQSKGWSAIQTVTIPVHKNLLRKLQRLEQHQSCAGVVAQNRAGCNIQSVATTAVVIQPAVAEACALYPLLPRLSPQNNRCHLTDF